MAPNQKPKQKRAAAKSLPSENRRDKTDSEPRRPRNRSNGQIEALRALISLVNLVPKDLTLPPTLALGINEELSMCGIVGEPVQLVDPQMLPSADEVKDAISRLPDGAETLKRFLLTRLEKVEANINMESDFAGFPRQVVIGLYQDIRHAREGFRQIIRRAKDFVGSIPGGPSVVHVDADHIVSVRLGHFETAIQGIDVSRLRECPICGRIFWRDRVFADAERGQGCNEECNRKIRNNKWAKRFEEKHGHPYRPKQKTPRFTEDVRRTLAAWPDFKRSYENDKELAARADITLSQCRAVLDHILPAPSRRKGKK